jgi:hypothetical protein
LCLPQFHELTFDATPSKKHLRRFALMCDNWDVDNPKSRLRSVEERLESRARLSEKLKQCWGLGGISRMLWLYFGDLFMLTFMRVVYLLAWSCHYNGVSGAKSRCRCCHGVVALRALPVRACCPAGV